MSLTWLIEFQVKEKACCSHQWSRVQATAGSSSSSIIHCTINQTPNILAAIFFSKSNIVLVRQNNVSFRLPHTLLILSSSCSISLSIRGRRRCRLLGWCCSIMTSLLPPSMSLIPSVLCVKSVLPHALLNPMLELMHHVNSLRTKTLKSLGWSFHPCIPSMRRWAATVPEQTSHVRSSPPTIPC